MTDTLKSYILPFIIGGSITSTIITLFYTGQAHVNSDRPKDVPYEKIAMFIPIIFGLFNVFNVYMINTFGYGDNFALITGALIGTTFSTVGRFGLNLPQKMFGMNENTEWYVHPIAVILYSLIFRFGVQNMNKLLGVIN